MTNQPTKRSVRILQGSQVDEAFTKKLLAETEPLDVIIDDGSHINEQVVTTFELLFPYVKSGGTYVVEDTQTSYWPDYGGTSENIQESVTMMNYFKHLTDSLNHQEFLIDNYQPTYYDQHIVGMHFYHNLIFIEKASTMRNLIFYGESIKRYEYTCTQLFLPCHPAGTFFIIDPFCIPGAFITILWRAFVGSLVCG